MSTHNSHPHKHEGTDAEEQYPATPAIIELRTGQIIEVAHWFYDQQNRVCVYFTDRKSGIDARYHDDEVALIVENFDAAAHALGMTDDELDARLRNDASENNDDDDDVSSLSEEEFSVVDFDDNEENRPLDEYTPAGYAHENLRERRGDEYYRAVDAAIALTASCVPIPPISGDGLEQDEELTAASFAADEALEEAVVEALTGEELNVSHFHYLNIPSQSSGGDER